MTFLLDTSVVVAALVRSHDAHPRCLPWLSRAQTQREAIASHALAETYSVLTSMPLTPRLAPAAAKELILYNLVRRLRVVSLAARDYTLVVRRLASAGLSGGILYDALHARAAEKAGATRVVTLDPAHFQRLTALFSFGVESP